MPKSSIRPSKDFTARTIAKITAASQRRRFWSDLAWPLLTFSPFAVRQLWLWGFYHRDVFSVSHWPLAQLFLNTYGFFVSALAAYLLLALGSGLVGWYFLRSRHFRLSLKSIRLRS